MNFEDYTAWLSVTHWMDPESPQRYGSDVEHAIDAIEEYVRADAESLEAYEQIACASGDPVIAFVMDLIFEDKRNQQKLLRRVARTLRDAVEWTHSTDALPAPTLPVTPPTADVIRIAQTALSDERSGARSLRQLADRCKGMNAGLISVLFERMARQTETHHRLLELVLQRSRARQSMDRLRERERSQIAPSLRALGTALTPNPEATGI
jgi:rubrerythrin